MHEGALLKIDAMSGAITPIPVDASVVPQRMAVYQEDLYLLVDRDTRTNRFMLYKLINEETGELEQYAVCDTDIATEGYPEYVNQLMTDPRFEDQKAMMEEGSIDLAKPRLIVGRAVLNVVGNDLMITDRQDGRSIVVFRDGAYKAAEEQTVLGLGPVLMYSREGSGKEGVLPVASVINGEVRIGLIGGFEVEVESNGKAVGVFQHQDRGRRYPIFCDVPYTPTVQDGQPVVWEVALLLNGVIIGRWQ